jgi:hypothetical protein
MPSIRLCDLPFLTDRTLTIFGVTVNFTEKKFCPTRGLNRGPSGYQINGLHRIKPVRSLVKKISATSLCVLHGATKWGGSLDETGKTEVTCHCRCGTMKIPPCSKALSAEHRTKFCRPSPAMVTSPYKWKILDCQCNIVIYINLIHVYAFCQITFVTITSLISNMNPSDLSLMRSYICCKIMDCYNSEMKNVETSIL